jgi:hypothetical protein
MPWMTTPWLLVVKLVTVAPRARVQGPDRVESGLSPLGSTKFWGHDEEEGSERVRKEALMRCRHGGSS